MLEPDLIDRLKSIEERYQELISKLTKSIVRDLDELQPILKEIAEIEEIAVTFNTWKKALVDIAGAKEIIRAETEDCEIQAMAQIEVIELDRQIADLEYKLRVFLLPQDPHDTDNVILEITAGIGGDEARIWADDLMGMYYRYAESQNWRAKVLIEYQHSNCGLDSDILSIKGDRVYGRLKFESGIHEVHRYAVLESKNKLNTLTANVTLMPEVDLSIFDVAAEDLEISHYNHGFRGMPRNPEAAVTLFHKPTTMRICCSTERRQRENIEIAWTILRAKLYLVELVKKQKECFINLQLERIDSEIDIIPLLTNDSEKIRTYNYLDNRVVDRRLEHDFDLNKIRAGDLTEVIEGCLDRDTKERLFRSNNLYRK